MDDHVEEDFIVHKLMLQVLHLSCEALNDRFGLRFRYMIIVLLMGSECGKRRRECFGYVSFHSF